MNATETKHLLGSLLIVSENMSGLFKSIEGLAWPRLIYIYIPEQPDLILLTVSAKSNKL